MFHAKHLWLWKHLCSAQELKHLDFGMSTAEHELGKHILYWCTQTLCHIHVKFISLDCPIHHQCFAANLHFKDLNCIVHESLRLLKVSLVSYNVLIKSVLHALSLIHQWWRHMFIHVIMKQLMPLDLSSDKNLWLYIAWKISLIEQNFSLIFLFAGGLLNNPHWWNILPLCT